MARVNPIKLSVYVLVLLALVVFVNEVLRARRTQAPRESNLDTLEGLRDGAGPQRSRTDLGRELLALPPPQLPVATEGALVLDAGEAAPQLHESREGQQRPLTGTRALMQLWQRYRWRRRIDENAFEPMRIKEIDRAAIRKITVEHRLRPRDLMGLSSEEVSKLLQDTEDSRRKAIEGLLGADLASAFFAAESSAELRARAADETGPPLTASGGDSGNPGDPAVPSAEAQPERPAETSGTVLPSASEGGVQDAGS